MKRNTAYNANQAYQLLTNRFMHFLMFSGGKDLYSTGNRYKTGCEMPEQVQPLAVQVQEVHPMVRQAGQDRVQVPVQGRLQLQEHSHL